VKDVCWEVKLFSSYNSSVLEEEGSENLCVCVCYKSTRDDRVQLEDVASIIIPSSQYS
jgi:hypothetical protein